MASRIPKMRSQASHLAIAEETAAPSSKARPAMVPTPTAQVKKGIPKAPTSSTPSAAACRSPSRQQPFARITTRLPAAPATITCLPSSSTSGPQHPVEEQPCGSRDEGLSPLITSDLCATDLLRSASSSSCGGCPSSSLSASSSCSLGSSSSSGSSISTTTTSNLSSFPASDSPSFPASSAASSSAERPTSSLPSSSSQAEQQPRTASDDTEPHSCCCTAPPPIAAATPLAMTAQGSSPAKLEELRQRARLEEIRQRLLRTLRPGSAAAVPDWPQTTDEERIAYLDLIKQRALVRLTGRLPPNYDCAGPVPQAPAPLAAVTEAEAVPVCASPRPSLATETKKEEAPAPDAPSEATAQLSKGPRRKSSKILRGMFGGCVGRNVEAL
ncbi:hypothetical protein PLESTB_001236800 [Pleodorina starrii]|uniref:Uncharacterized protein n=1 Tax=Pleodorina starrii TaxID=330485 RepID=A0A9W6F6E6_9CHLO|nr:hypothetical protein PLESTM_000222900 [Pleodorina starrii]GLC57525.1 hypothetical protein PLESTB_001236800 [Pleodorina starrii]